jgi:hypothetical protein
MTLFKALERGPSLEWQRTFWFSNFASPCIFSVWCTASVNGLAGLDSAVSSHLCAVSIILRINKRARHRSVNILAGQSSCGFHWLVIKKKKKRWSVRESFPLVRNECNVLCAACCYGLLIISYRPSVHSFTLL